MTTMQAEQLQMAVKARNLNPNNNPMKLEFLTMFGKDQRQAKVWNEIQPNRMSSQQIAWLIATAKCYDIDFNFECGQDWAFVRLY